MKKTKIICFAAAIIFFLILFFFDITDAAPLPLLDKSTFSESEKSSIIIHPNFTNYTTSLILYVSNGDNPETWTYEPETLGFGDFLFSDYFSFGSPTGRYLLVEYINDGQTFSCYGIPSTDCIANPHFISQFSFEVTTNTPIAQPVLSFPDTGTSPALKTTLLGTLSGVLATLTLFFLLTRKRKLGKSQRTANVFKKIQ